MTYHVRLKLWIYNTDRSNHLRGEMDIALPFPPQAGMHIEYEDMQPLHLKRVIWRTHAERFECLLESDTPYEFDLDSDVAELTDVLDVLRDARRHGWKGLDRIYRDK